MNTWTDVKNELFMRGFKEEAGGMMRYARGSISNYDIVQVYPMCMMTSLSAEKDVPACHVFYESFSEPGYLEADVHSKSDFNIAVSDLTAWLQKKNILTRAEIEAKRKDFSERIRAAKERRMLKRLCENEPVEVYMHGSVVNIPIIDYLEIYAINSGFDSLEELLSEGNRIPDFEDVTYDVLLKYDALRNTSKNN